MENESLFQIRVVCYSGQRGEETPRKFYLGERLIEVAEVVEHWPVQKYRYFKLCSTEADLYILRHDCSTDCWVMTLFESRENFRLQSLKHPPSQ